jgi:hypothetical protein
MARTLQQDVAEIRLKMEEVVRKAAALKGSIGFQTEYADNYWTISIDERGVVYNKNYAEESHGSTRQISDLALWEMARILETLEE